MIRTTVVHAGLLFIAASTTIAGGFPASDSAERRPGQSLVVVIPVDFASQIGGAEVLAESLRVFGGSLAAVPVRVYAPSDLAEAISERTTRFDELGVEVRTFEVPPGAERFFLGAKPFAAARAESDATSFDLVAILAPNTIVLRTPEAFLLPATATLGYSTVHHQNVGSAASAPPDPFWSRLFSVLGIAEDRIFTNRTLADRVDVRFYFNAGSFVVRPECGLLEAWAAAFRTLAADPEIAELAAGGPRNIFLHQAALAGAALARLRPGDTVELPAAYSYPLFFERFHGGDVTFDSLEGVVTMRVEFRTEDLPDGWDKEVAGPRETVSWVRERLGN